MEAIILAAIVTLILKSIFDTPAQPQPQGRPWDFRLNLLAVGGVLVFGVIAAVFIWGIQP